MERSRRHAADDVEHWIRSLRRESERRDNALTHIFSQIGTALETLRATPLVKHDELCRNLAARIAHAGTIEDFADRVADLHGHIMRMGKRAASEGELWEVATGHSPGRLDLSGSSTANGFKAGRHRIRL